MNTCISFFFFFFFFLFLFLFFFFFSLSFLFLLLFFFFSSSSFSFLFFFFSFSSLHFPFLSFFGIFAEFAGKLFLQHHIKHNQKLLNTISQPRLFPASLTSNSLFKPCFIHIYRIQSSNSYIHQFILLN